MKKAQSLTEYALVISLIAVTMVGLQTFFRRGLQAHIKQVADRFGSQTDYTLRKYPYLDLDYGISISEGEMSGYEEARVDTTSDVSKWDWTRTSRIESSKNTYRTAGY